MSIPKSKNTEQRNKGKEAGFYKQLLCKINTRRTKLKEQLIFEEKNAQYKKCVPLE